MAQPAEDILLIATQDLGADGYVSKSAPTGLVLTEGFSKQSLSYQKLNYMQNNSGNWLKYLFEEFIPESITTALLSRDEARYPVGHILLTMTDTNPSAQYIGTWTLLYTADSDIKLGDGTVQDGVATGGNNPAVPLKNHAHSATFTGTALPTHSHTTAIQTVTNIEDNGAGTGLDINGSTSTSAVSAGTPAGSVTVNTTGDGATPTLDVSGKGVAINVWQRTV